MNGRFYVGTFLWGVVLTLAGATLAVVGFGWWDMPAIELGYVFPVLLILVGAVVLVGALTHDRNRRAEFDLRT
jgi:membrane protein DedA with SNARE-associated domain